MNTEECIASVRSLRDANIKSEARKELTEAMNTADKLFIVLSQLILSLQELLCDKEKEISALKAEMEEMRTELLHSGIQEGELTAEIATLKVEEYPTPKQINDAAIKAQEGYSRLGRRLK